MKNLLDELKLADQYYLYLYDHGQEFTDEGFPIFKRDNFLDKWPELVVPYYNRKSKLVIEPKKTVLCHFSKDIYIYPRLENILNDLPIYQQFLGVIGSDITVTEDMDKEWQKFQMLINQLFLAILAQNKIKIIFNTRSGNKVYPEVFFHIPKGIMCASSTLGCKQEKFPYDYRYLSKILYLFPSKLIIYGKESTIMLNQLRNMGISYHVYPDFHRLSKKGGNDV